MSRPMSSVPSQCFIEGPTLIRGKLAVGECGAISGANTATTTSRRRNAAPIMAVRSRTNRDARRLRTARPTTLVVASAPCQLMPSAPRRSGGARFARSRDAHLRVEDAVTDVDEQVHDDEHHGRQENDAL